IKQQIRDQMKNHSNKIYWSEKEDAASDVQPFKKIKNDQPFYINEKHQLVVVFRQGHIAPYYIGTPEFVIPNELIDNEL
ncbi:RsiV family protein, partial [Enterococcus faecalis]|uniref:RsiV family protein n=1 Tax=Enterococcus faecalis TaxID=1351 RepID=UPI003D6C0ACE